MFRNKKELLNDNLKNLSHGVELSSQVIMSILGDNVASTIQSERVDSTMIQSTVAAKMKSSLLNNKPK